MKKVLFYINTLGKGGAERVIKNLSEQFALNGFASILVTSFLCKQEYQVNSNVKRIALYDKRLKGFIFRNIRLISKLKKTIKNENPDVVISFMGESNFRSILATRKTKTKCIVSVRNDPEKEYRSFFSRLLAKKLYKKTDGIVFQTEDAMKWFSKPIQLKSKVILNQVDSLFFDTFYDGERKDIVSVGRLVEQKNHELLIKAFSLISNETKDNLIIYGDGPLRQKLSLLIKDLQLEGRVMLPGTINNVSETIKSAKLFVLSSYYEGMPNALMEALALGLPCVSTDCPCGGPKQIIVNNFNGLLVQNNNSNSLAEAMIKILKNKGLQSQFSIESKKMANNMFSPSLVFKTWKLYIEEVCQYE